MTACLSQLKEQGTTANLHDLVNFQDFQELMGVPKYLQLEQQFGMESRDAPTRGTLTL
jgi:methylisocitrate lyase